jgi:DNA-binding beta-propeller fold protein YncE
VEVALRRLRALFCVGSAMLSLAATGGCSKRTLPTEPVGVFAGYMMGLFPSYRFVQAWGGSGSGNGQFERPQGLAVDAGGNVYVVDTANRRIQKFTDDGRYLMQWGSAGTADGQFGYMNSVAVDASGNVYVADAENSRIQKFNSDGTFLTKWGTLGYGDGQFNDDDLAVTVDAAGNVYVADTGHSRIQKFTTDGTYVTQWGTAGFGAGKLFWPRGVAVDSRGDVYVADGAHSIQKFNSAGVYLKGWAMRDALHGSSEHVAVDPEGNVYATDRYTRCIKKFTSDGFLIGRWEVGSWSWTPALAAGANGAVYVTDTENNRVEKFAPSR